MTTTEVQISSLPFSQIPQDGEFCVKLITTKQRLQDMIDALEYARQLWDNENFNHFADLWEALKHLDDPCRCCDDCTGDTNCPDCGGSGGAGENAPYCITIRDEDEDEDDMGCKLDIEYRNNTPYLRMDCGCGQAKYFALTESQTTDTGEPVAPEDTSYTYFPTNVSQNNASCYATKASNYLIDRAKAFWKYVFDLAAVGVDAIAPNDEIFDAAIVITQFLGDDDLNEIISGLTNSAVASALDAIKPSMETNWTYTGKVNRAELLKWTQTAPYFQNAVPVRELLFLWASTSFVINYNKDLSKFAAECESGNTLGSLYDDVIEITSGGQQYNLYTITTNLTGAGDLYTTPVEYTNIRCIISRVQHSQAGSTQYVNHSVGSPLYNSAFARAGQAGNLATEANVCAYASTAERDIVLTAIPMTLHSQQLLTPPGGSNPVEQRINTVNGVTIVDTSLYILVYA